MWEYALVIGAVIVGGFVVFLLLRREAKGEAPGCCAHCPYGRRPSECEPPAGAADLPPDCEKYK
jgi:hypothetical protein